MIFWSIEGLFLGEGSDWYSFYSTKH